MFYSCILFGSLCSFKPATVLVTSELPLGSGLGSSASFCVALAAALLAYTDSVSFHVNHQGWLSFGEKDLELVNQWAFEGEKIIHGKPSGIDNTVSAYGTPLPFYIIWNMSFCIYLVTDDYNFNLFIWLDSNGI